MTIQKVTCTNSCQHAIMQFALESICNQEYTNTVHSYTVFSGTPCT